MRAQLFLIWHTAGPYVVLVISDRPDWRGHRAYKAHELQSGKAYNAKGADLTRLEGFEKNHDCIYKIELTKYWTQYEAIMKLVGTGFSGELDDETMEAYEKRVVFRELEDYVIAVVTE